MGPRAPYRDLCAAVEQARQESTTRRCRDLLADDWTFLGPYECLP